MRQQGSFGFIVVTIALAIAGASGLARQWQERLNLRSELERARMGVAEISRLQAENQRLRGEQISAEELEALRADHAAIPRLRAELEALEKRAAAGRR